MYVGYAQPPKVICRFRDCVLYFFWHFLSLLHSPPLFVYGRTNHVESSMFNEVKTCYS